jgi:hypothetical protein
MNIADRGLKQELILDVLRRHGRCRLQVSGTSMLPALWPGDTVAIEHRPLTDMRVGDIVFYERGGRLILHRLVALPAGTFPARLVTRGDSMPHSDPAVRLDSVLGVLAGVRRGEDWVAVPRSRTSISRLAAWLARSSGLVRLVLRIRSIPKTDPDAPLWSRFFVRDGAGSRSAADAPPEVPAS